MLLEHAPLPCQAVHVHLLRRARGQHAHARGRCDARVERLEQLQGEGGIVERTCGSARERERGGSGVVLHEHPPAAPGRVEAEQQLTRRTRREVMATQASRRASAKDLIDDLRSLVFAAGNREAEPLAFLLG